MILKFPPLVYTILFIVLKIALLILGLLCIKSQTQYQKAQSNPHKTVEVPAKVWLKAGEVLGKLGDIEYGLHEEGSPQREP